MTASPVARPASFIAFVAAAIAFAIPTARAETSSRPGNEGSTTPVTPRTEKPPEARALSHAFAMTAKAVRPSVVRIDVEIGGPEPGHGRRGARPRGGVPPFFRHFFDFGDGGEEGEGEGEPMAPGRGTGSGVIFDTQGVIVTNSHVVEHATKVTVVLFDGEEIPAKVVGRDPRTDLALIRLLRLPKNLVVARLGDSERLEVGEWVLAIGSPLGLDQTVTAGIVSGKGHVGRNVQMSGERMRTYISTDAKINPGNSGGPLVDLNGEVVGINTLIDTGPGGAYGFAIPVNEVKRVTEALLKEGRVRYPYLGVMVGDVATLEAQTKEKLPHGTPDKGAFVSQATAGGPAAAAGLRPGDVITKIDDKPIDGANDVIDYVSSRTIGAKVTVAYVRDGKPGSAQVTLGELPPAEAEGPEVAGALGMELQTLTPEIASALGLPATAKGAVISDVAAGSPAEAAGLGPGDVILDVDRKPVADAGAAMTALAEPHKGGHVLRVEGRRGTRQVTVPSP
jgi:serine protease Do